MMEIPKSRKTTLNTKKLWAAMAFLLLSAFWWLWPDEAPAIPLTEVRQGRMQDSTPLMGRIRPQVERSLLTRVGGTLAQVMVRPGDKVQPDDVLLKLQNIDIEQGLVAAKMDLLAATASAKELKTELIREQKTLSNQIELSKARLNLQSAELEAKQQLAAKNIISGFDLRHAQLSVQQVALELTMQQQQLDDFAETAKARQEVADANLQQAQAKLEVAQSNLDALQIKAGIAGIVQHLDQELKIGQWLNAGQSIGSVADPTRLYAEVKVIASHASRLSPGQQVRLDIKGETATASISHIEPNVVDNQVQLRLTLGELPATARLNIEVTGEIVTFDKLTLLSERPAYIDKANQQAAVWVQSGSSTQFVKKLVSVGAVSRAQIEILAGLQAGDIVALAEPNSQG